MELIILPMCKKDDETDCSNHRGISLFKLRTKFYPTSCCQVLQPIINAEEKIGDHQ